MKCFICENNIVGKYFIDAWNHRICEKHVNNDVVLCSSCHVFTKKEHVFEYDYTLCPICSRSAVTTNDSIDIILKSVINKLSRAGFKIDFNTVTIKICDAREMAKVRNSSINIMNKGLTLTEVHSSIGAMIFGAKKFKHNIYMLNHMPKIEFAGILAHELLHVWQTQNGINLSSKLTEGLCNMGSYLMYTQLGGTVTEYYIKALFENTDPIYGDGFKYVYAKYEEIGWDGIKQKALNNEL